MKATGTEADYFQLDNVKRKIAQTWQLPIESQEIRDGSQKAVYAQLMEDGVTAFVTDAPKAFNTMLGISHVIASTVVSHDDGDGPKVAYLMVRYDDGIDGSTVTKDTYRVKGYEVEDAYTVSDESSDDKAATGHSVIIKLKPNETTDASATTVVYRQVLPIKTETGETYTERLLLRNTMAKTL